MVGWGLVAAGSTCGIAAAAIKGGTFEALTAAGTAFMGAAAVASRGPETMAAQVLIATQAADREAATLYRDATHLVRAHLELPDDYSTPRTIQVLHGRILTEAWR